MKQSECFRRTNLLVTIPSPPKVKDPRRFLNVGRSYRNQSLVVPDRIPFVGSD
jgi:hypothetical protein